MEHTKQIRFLLIIADRKKKDKLLTSLLSTGARVINAIYAKGSVNAGSFQNVFGFVPEENKIVLTCLLPREKSDETLKMLVRDFHFDKPNTGIAITIPVEGLSY